MSEKINTAARNLQANSLADQFDGGTLEIYTGAQPSSANDSPTGTLLCTITLPTPAFGAAASGEAAKAGTWSDVGLDDDDAGWFRLSSSDDTIVIDGAVTATSGGGELELSTITIETGIDVVVTTFKIVQPAS